MRAFFALDIAPDIQCAIERWRNRTMLPAGRAVPAANFHITLNFLGDIAPAQLDRLCVEAGQIHAPELELRVDTPGYFPRPGIFWIGPRETPPDLTALVAHLRRASKKAGIKTPRKPFEPHITLFRNCQTRPPLPTQPPDFTLPCNNFTLFQSLTNHKGVRYQAVHRWVGR